MYLHRHLLWVLVPAVLLPLTGCDDSKNPLSDPQTAKTDERLVGVWLERGGDAEVYYHVGHAGEKFPRSVLRVVEIKHSPKELNSPQEFFVFPSVIGKQTYLNVILDANEVKRLDEKGWKAEGISSFTFLKYQFDGDNKLVLWLIDEKTKQRVIEGGKIKGVVEKGKPAKFTDTTENIARFIAQASDALWDTDGPAHFERVVVGKKR